MEYRKSIAVCALLVILFCTIFLKLRNEEELPAPSNRIFNIPHEAAELETSDIIYHTRTDARNYIPVVNEEYKTVFFFVGKCAASFWKRMFVRMMGSPQWCRLWIHKKELNGLKWLDDYSIEEAQRFMTDPEWTRAIFVRNPKERALSAFLDKAVAHSDSFVKATCGVYGNKGGDYQECVDHHLEFGFFLQNITTTIPWNVHWMPIYDQIDAKWWPYINYVGYMKNLSDDAEDFLRSIVSDVDGVSAWERWGKTGWSDDEKNCSATDNKPFLMKREQDHQVRHETDAHDKLREYYTPELEKFVEGRYETDLNNAYFHFDSTELHPHN